MKQTLQLKLGQHLTMTPQLQQAIRLLQLSTLELQTEIQEALESNPMLEITEDGGSDDAADNSGGNNSDNNSNNNEANSASNTDAAAPSAENRESVDVSERAVDKQEQEIPNDLPTDSDWEDTYDSSAESYSAGTRNNDSSGEMSGFEQADNSGQNLQDHLLWQLNLSTCSDTEIGRAHV